MLTARMLQHPQCQSTHQAGNACCPHHQLQQLWLTSAFPAALAAALADWARLARRPLQIALIVCCSSQALLQLACG